MAIHYLARVARPTATGTYAGDRRHDVSLDGRPGLRDSPAKNSDALKESESAEAAESETGRTCTAAHVNSDHKLYGDPALHIVYIQKKNSEKNIRFQSWLPCLQGQGMNNGLLGCWNRNLNPPERITRGHALAQHGAKF